MAQDFEVVCLEPVVEAVLALSTTDQKQIIRQLRKLERDPSLGQPLRNDQMHSLAGCQRLVSGRLRVVYEVDRPARQVVILAVGARESQRVYEIADAERAKRLRRIV